MPDSTPDPVPIPSVEHRILLIRRYKVLLDSDLAHLYQVSTGRRLIEAPEDDRKKRFGFPAAKKSPALTE
jgi:hypothetical protein